MKLLPHSVLLGLCWVLITVTETSSTFVPGRCLCPQTQRAVRGQLKELTVVPISASCQNVTVIVTLKNNQPVCLNPEGLMGKQLIRCWKRVHKLGLDVKLCLRRRRRARGGQRQRQRQRRRGHNRKQSPSNSQ